jgi:hypothetical protein
MSSLCSRELANCLAEVGVCRIQDILPLSAAICLFAGLSRALPSCDDLGCSWLCNFFVPDFEEPPLQAHLPAVMLAAAKRGPLLLPP